MDEFLVGGWSAVVESEITDKNTLYRDMQDFTEAGFNFTGLQRFEDEAKLKLVLDAFEKYEIMYFFECRDLEHGYNDSIIEDNVAKYCSRPNCLGVFLIDEPSVNDFKQISDLRNVYRKYMPKCRYAAANLFPNYANSEQLGIKPFGTPRVSTFDGVPSNADDFIYEEYYQYVDHYLNIVSPEVLTYDHYLISDKFRASAPIREKHIYRFMENLSIISSVARNRGIPFWNVIQSLSYCDHMLSPDYYEYKWMTGISYVMGSRNNVSFVYRNLFEEGQGAEKWFDTPVSLTGRKTFEYEVVKSVNSEIRNFAHVFLKYEHIGIIGHELPWYIAKAVERNKYSGNVFYLKKIEGHLPVLIGYMSHNRKSGLLVMNTDIYNSGSLSLSFDNSLRLEVWGKDGLESDAFSDNVQLRLDRSEMKFICYE